MWRRLKALSKHRWFHPGLLVGWMLLGAILRFSNLDFKALWTDEFSTIVFSLGNSFRSIPFDRVIPIDTLLHPLRPNPQADLRSVLQHLLNESNHPPLYFVLTHLWLRLFPPDANGLVTAWQVRSLSALFGVLSIPASFGLAWVAFRSRRVGQLAAALMAVSPFGVYLAQEARHYTLPILWQIASLACLIVAARTIKQRRPLPLWVGLIWIVVNCLGVATHYFFILTLVAEALVIGLLGLLQSWRESGIWYPSYWWRLLVVGMGTMAGTLLWLPFILRVQEGDLTQWIVDSDRTGLDWLDPIPRVIGGWITMLYLLPVQGALQAVVAASSVVLVALVLWTLPKLIRGWRASYAEPKQRLSIQVLGAFVLGAIVLMLGITYALGIDLTAAFRYHFYYFPAVIVLVAAALAIEWKQATHPPQTQGILNRLLAPNRNAVALVIVMGVIGSLTVILNLGYQKTHRPDRAIHEMVQTSYVPMLISISHQTHGQTGRMMGLALELQQQTRASSAPQPQFYLDHQKCRSLDDPNCHIPTLKLRSVLTELERPFDVWLVNYHSSANLREQNCYADPEFHRRVVDGYKYHLYHCPLVKQ